MGRKGAHDVALQVLVSGFVVFNPGGTGVHASKRVVEIGVAEGIEAHLAVDVRLDTAAVGAALHANLVPEVLIVDGFLRHVPCAGERVTRKGAAKGLGDEAHVSGNNECLVDERSRGNDEACLLSLCFLQAKGARLVPVSGKVALGAGEAVIVVSALERALADIGEFGRKVARNLRPVFEQLADETVVIDAAKVLAQPLFVIGVAHGACQGV